MQKNVLGCKDYPNRITSMVIGHRLVSWARTPKVEGSGNKTIAIAQQVSGLVVLQLCVCVCVCVNLTLANPSARVRCHSSPQGWQSH